MSSKKSVILRNIVLLSILLIIVILSIVVLLKGEEDKDEKGYYNEEVINETSIIDEKNLNIIDNEYNNSTNENDTSIGNMKNEKMVRSRNIDIYFLIKDCLEKYYSNYSSFHHEELFQNETDEEITVDRLWYYIDEEAKEKLELNIDNISELHETLDFPMFRIDDILEQKLTETQDIYLVYHQVEEAGNKVVLVKIDNKNNTFSIYPYEYLQKYQYTTVKENDILDIEGKNDILKNDFNTWSVPEEEISELDCAKELYGNFKYDLYYDLEHLYSKINENYKKIHYENYENFDKFKNYIQENYNEFDTDQLEKYSAIKNNVYIEYTVIGKNKKSYIFSAKSLTNYDIMLDSYSIESLRYLNAYQNMLPEVKGKYCINRVISAINEKNYRFVYDKLNTAQKNNYYPNYDDFENFIKNNFFEKNDFEFQGDELNISTTVYQYIVKIVNLSKQSESKLYTFAIYLKEEGDFEVSIVKL